MPLTFIGSPMSRIAFQGELGAYSHLACRTVFPELEPLPCRDFADAFAAVRAGEAQLAMIPVDNSIAGRVADIHHLLPDGGLHIIGEHFQPIRHQLMALPGVSLDQVKLVRSHVHALSQCRRILRDLGLTAAVHADTAGSARELAERGVRDECAIASTLAAEIYGLEILRRDIEDEGHNTTRFLVLSPDEAPAPPQDSFCMTSLVFEVRSIPATLYKALGGFATNGVNIVKLESYMVDGRFVQARFFLEVEGHVQDPRMGHALDELRFFARDVKVLGCYPGHAFRRHDSQLYPAEMPGLS